MKKNILILIIFSFLSCFLWGCGTVEPKKSSEPVPVKKNIPSSAKKKTISTPPQSKPGVFSGDREVSDDF